MNLQQRMAPRTPAKPVKDTFQQHQDQTMKVTSLRLPKDVHTKAKVYAVEHNMTLTDVVTEALEEFLN